MTLDIAERDTDGIYRLSVKLRNGSVVTVSHRRWRLVMKRARQLMELDGGLCHER